MYHISTLLKRTSLYKHLPLTSFSVKAELSPVIQTPHQIRSKIPAGLAVGMAASAVAVTDAVADAAVQTFLVPVHGSVRQTRITR